MPFSIIVAPSAAPTARAASTVLVFHSSLPTCSLMEEDMVPIAHSVFWFSSSITCTYVCWFERYTEMRGRSAVPLSLARIFVWRFCRRFSLSVIAARVSVETVAAASRRREAISTKWKSDVREVSEIRVSRKEKHATEGGKTPRYPVVALSRRRRRIATGRPAARLPGPSGRRRSASGVCRSRRSVRGRSRLAGGARDALRSARNKP